MLCSWRDRSHKKEQSVAKLDEQSTAVTATSTTAALLNTFLVTQLNQMNQQRLSPPARPGSLPNHSAPLNSSPICTQKDPQDLLAEFFDWLMKQPGYNTEKKIELYTNIKNTLIEEEWEIDTLRERRDGKDMTEDRWIRYGFKIGTLAMIRTKISEFKLQRPCSSSSLSSYSSIS